MLPVAELSSCGLGTGVWLPTSWPLCLPNTFSFCPGAFALALSSPSRFLEGSVLLPSSSGSSVPLYPS